jgi:hypothetical protein
MKIEMGKKYTSNGQQVRILCVDRPCNVYPVVAMYDNGVINYFTEDGIISKICIIMNPNEDLDKYNLVEVWEPTENEWCLFWDVRESKAAVLAKFVGMTQSGLFKDYDWSDWKYCIKFTGELPEHLKEI